MDIITTIAIILGVIILAPLAYAFTALAFATLVLGTAFVLIVGIFGMELSTAILITCYTCGFLFAIILAIGQASTTREKDKSERK